MISVLLSVFLLVGSPIQSQDSVTVAKETLHNLEDRLETVELRMERYSARENYFESILSEQRQSYVTIILGLLGILGIFGYFSFLIERKRLERYVNDKINGVMKNLQGVEDRLGKTKNDAVEASASAYKLFAIRNRNEGASWAALRDTVDALNQISNHDEIDETKREIISKDISKALLDTENINMSDNKITKELKKDLTEKIESMMKSFGGSLRKETIELYKEVENLKVIESEEDVESDA